MPDVHVDVMRLYLYIYYISLTSVLRSHTSSAEFWRRASGPRALSQLPTTELSNYNSEFRIL